MSVSAVLQPIARLPRWSQLLLVAIIARAATFGNPIVHVDEEFYFVTAHEMWRGAVPFVDIWDRKPIGLFLLYMPAAALPLPWGTLAYQATALLSLVATAWLVAWLARAAGWRAGALPGAIAYILWPDLLNGAGGQSPIFYNLLTVSAAALVVAGETSRHRRLSGCLAMAIIGIALQLKYSVVFEGFFFGVWLLWREWRTERSPVGFVLYGAAMVSLALLPTAAVVAYYAAIGQIDALIFTNFTSIQRRSADPLPEALGNIGTLALILSPIVAMALAARGQASGGDGPARRFMFMWFGVALAALALFAPWFDHYGLPLLVPGCACAAGILGNPRFRRLGSILLVLVAVGGQIAVFRNIDNRGNAAQFTALARAVGKGPGCLYVYSGTAMLYAESGRCRLTRFAFPSSLTRVRDADSLGVDPAEEIARIFARKPAIVVMRPPFRGERPEIRRQVLAVMARDYHLSASVPMGRETISVFDRRSGD